MGPAELPEQSLPRVLAKSSDVDHILARTRARGEND